ncbi:hypothetical protein N9Y60_05110 [Crocinitomicaceae bacterium]|nr:hypothetical protein [Crocinitomicaceae bacterium]
MSVALLSLKANSSAPASEAVVAKCSPTKNAAPPLILPITELPAMLGSSDPGILYAAPFGPIALIAPYVL